MRKRRTRSHIIADLSANHFERQALLCGYSVERVINDYGVDLLLYTYNDEGEVEEGLITVQLKATDNLSVLQDGETIAFPIETADLNYWLAMTYPMILVVYNAQLDTAHWLYVQAYLQSQRQVSPILVGNTMTLRLKKSNLVTPDAIRQFAGFRDQIAQQLKGVTHGV